ncbi:MAG: LysM peptidoglycan-binding domain-containing protein [Verrucomicrobiota bacterium]|nr:LysM peptidoglycan-binding domain-containing protein [Verrucomicrobiota bacterium]
MPGQGNGDDEKEPHYLLGESRLNAMDYAGAARAFEESLEVNPHSAAAHYQLAMLYDTQAPDPAAAIYHYEQYLKYDPNAPNAVIVTQRIEACKEQLASDVLALPSSSSTEQQLEKLIAQNHELQDEVNKWRQAYNALHSAQMGAAAPVATATAPAAGLEPAPPPRTVTEPAKAAGTPAQWHRVVPGETAMAICREYGIRFTSLEAANPGVNLTRLRVGQMLKVPRG